MGLLRGSGRGGKGGRWNTEGSSTGKHAGEEGEGGRMGARDGGYMGESRLSGVGVKMISGAGRTTGREHGRKDAGEGEVYS